MEQITLHLYPGIDLVLECLKAAYETIVDNPHFSHVSKGSISTIIVGIRRKKINWHGRSYKIYLDY